MAGMTLSEAARTLGVGVDADRQAVDRAARQLIKRWHPDAWRNASPAEQRRAADEFMRVNKAQRIMHHPEEAEPEPSAYDAYGGYQPQPSWSSYAPVDTDPHAAAAGRPAGDGARARRGAATGIDDMFGQVPDTMEQTLNDMHNNEVTKRYRQVAVLIRLTSSAFASALMLGVSLFLMFVALGTADLPILPEDGSLASDLATLVPDVGGTPTALTFLALCVVMLLKMATYDAFFSYYLTRGGGRLNPTLLFGAEACALAVSGIMLAGAMPIAKSAYTLMLVVGIAAACGGVALAIWRDARSE